MSMLRSLIVGMLVLAAGCRGNPQYYDDTESALGRPTGHNPATVAMGSYKGQTTCPVSGEKLGSMGSPIPTTVKGEIVYVCCSQCLDKLNAEPDKYLAKVRAERTKVNTERVNESRMAVGDRQSPIQQASFRDAPPFGGQPTRPNPGLYNGQITCPVMDVPLDPNGKARAVQVKDETIYVCCGKCAMRVRLQPDKYLAKVRAERQATAAQLAAHEQTGPPDPDPIPSALPSSRPPSAAINP